MYQFAGGPVAGDVADSFEAITEGAQGNFDPSKRK
jgi:hypothetical protein